MSHTCPDTIVGYTVIVPQEWSGNFGEHSGLSGVKRTYTFFGSSVYHTNLSDDQVVKLKLTIPFVYILKT